MGQALLYGTMIQAGSICCLRGRQSYSQRGSAATRRHERRRLPALGAAGLPGDRGLNNGYGADGTIPTPDKYADFARRCANYIRNSPGCTHWIIGNEPNHAQERLQGQPISAQEYVGCFMQAATAVYEGVAQHQLIAAAVAPWNVETGDWLYYMERMLAGLQGYATALRCTSIRMAATRRW